jgi:hypothetical protein
MLQEPVTAHLKTRCNPLRHELIPPARDKACSKVKRWVSFEVTPQDSPAGSDQRVSPLGQTGQQCGATLHPPLRIKAHVDICEWLDVSWK